MKRLLVSAAVSATLLLGSAGFAQGAVRWDSVGAVTCEFGTVQGWAPSVASSGYVAWIPLFAWYPEVGGGPVYHWGYWKWAYRGDNVWRNFANSNETAPNETSPEQYPGRYMVYNYVYDYDTGSYSGNWSRWWARNPVTGAYNDSGFYACAQ